MRRLVAVTAVLGLGASLLSTTTSGAAGGGRSPIAADRPAWAVTANRRGPTPASEPVSVRVYLRWRDLEGAKARAAAVSDPSSPDYAKFLTPEQVRATYAPTPDAVTTVTTWLAAQGLTIGSVPENGLFVPATGTAAQIATAFATQLDQYSVGGRSLHAAASPPSVPAELAPVMSGVAGLDSTTGMRRPTHVSSDPGPASGPNPAARTRTSGTPAIAPPPSGFRNSPPCSQYWGQVLDLVDPPYKGYPKPLPYAPCGYVPAQLRSGYGIDGAVRSGNDGRNVRVAILDAYASPTILGDATSYAQRFDAQYPLRRSQFSQIVLPETNPALEAPGLCDASGWYGEETLDVEAVHAMAPGARILYVGAASCLDEDLDAALNLIVDRHLADIVSNSYGNLGEDVPAAEVAAFDTITTQAALEGIGLYFSSGDGGDEAANLPAPSADFPASSAWVTAVGGTSLGVDARGGIAVQRGWETGFSGLAGRKYSPPPPGDFLYGSGGGTSRLYPEPSYQRGVVPEKLAHRFGAHGRVVPDVATVGDPNTGMLIGETQTFSDGVYFDTYRIGGTSLSCPLFAGVMALADQRAGHAHGFANPALYRLNGSDAYTDVAPGSNQAVARVNFVNGENANKGLSTSVRTFDYPRLTIHTAEGYDDVTGMGTPNGSAFLRRLR